MNPIDELKQEHEGVMAALDILSAIVERFGENEEIGAVEDLERLIEFFTIFVDTCHHGKEEELLFPALENAGVSKEGGPIGVMLSDHETGRGHVRALRSALAGYKAGKRSLAAEIREHADAYAIMLRLHIEKENLVLFHLADMHLSEETKRHLEEGFERIEADRVGLGKHEMFHGMLDQLHKKYPGKSA
jgi:hemerythrin-like domain-containing protein